MFPSTIAIPAFLLLTFLYILTIILRPNNHNKATGKRPPGPLALPVIGNFHLLGTYPHRSLQSLAKKYGPIMSFRLGQVPAIVVSSPEAAELFLKTHDPVFASRPITQAVNYIFYGSKSLVFAEYGSYWRNMRKLCSQHLLNASKVELFSPIRREELRKMVKSIERAAKTGEVVNISEKIHHGLEDLVYKMIMGRSEEDKLNLLMILSKGTNLTGAFNLADYVPWLEPFDLQGLLRRFKETRKELDHVLEKIIKGYEQAPSTQKDEKPKDFMDILLSLMHHQNQEISRDHIKGIARDLIGGAFETTTVAIEWTLSELLRNPRALNNLQDELKAVIGMNRMVEEMDLSKLNYLDMVVKEAFRLHPAGAFIPRAPTEDAIVDGYSIPKNARVLINLWAIGRDPKVWSDNADMFYPERFLNSNIDLQGLDFELTPFGSGRRKCPGMQVGLTIVKLVIAQLVHCFNWELPHGMAPCDLDMTEAFGLALPKSKPLSAVLTHRLSLKAYNE